MTAGTGGHAARIGAAFARATRLLAATAFVAAAALSAPAPCTAQLLGVNVHPEEPRTMTAGAYNAALDGKVLDAMRAAGARMVRVPVPWAWIEPSAPGRVDYRYVHAVDAYVRAVRRRRMRVLMIFGGTPCWATTDPIAACVGGHYTDADQAGGNYPPASDADAGGAAALMAARWHPDAIEVWNEPNTPAFFTALAGQDTAFAYTNVVKAVYSAVKGVSPATMIVAGALAGADTGFLQRLYSDGIAAYSDAISIHPYSIRFTDPFEYWGDPAAPFAGDAADSLTMGVPAIEQVMAANGDGAKPLWITEVGASACNPSYYCLDEETQAGYLRAALDQISAWPYVQVALVYQAIDTSSDMELWNGFGLLRHDGSRRPAYCVLAAATGADPGCRSDRLRSERAAQDDLTRAWILARSYYLSHNRSFAGFTPAMLTQLDTSFGGFDLLSNDERASQHAYPKLIGIDVEGGGAIIELCNASARRAYCIRETTGAQPAIAHGQAAHDVFSAAGATRTGASTAWTPTAPALTASRKRAVSCRAPRRAARRPAASPRAPDLSRRAAPRRRGSRPGPRARESRRAARRAPCS